MGCRKRRRCRLRAGAKSKHRPWPLNPFASSANRRVLLGGTALATSLIAGVPTEAPAQAVVFRPLAMTPQVVTNNRNCISPGTCALINTIAPFASIDFTNTGDFAVLGLLPSAIYMRTNYAFSPIDVTNSGDLATAGIFDHGISAYTYDFRSRIRIVNSGDIATTGINAYGIYGYTYGNSSSLTISNSGAIATQAFDADGIFGGTFGNGSNLTITNSGNIATRGFVAEGVYATTVGINADLTVVNSGRITTSGPYAAGIYALTYGDNSSLRIVNSGDITTTGPVSLGVYAITVGANSPLTIQNSGRIRANGPYSAAIFAYSATSTTIINQPGGSISAASNFAIDTEGASTTIQNSGTIDGFIDLTDSPDSFTNMPGGVFNATNTSYFGGGRDVFSNNTGGTVRAANVTGNEIRFDGLEQFNNAGLITTQNNRSNSVFRLSNTLGGTDLNFRGLPGSMLGVDAFLSGPGSTADNVFIEGNVSGRTELLVQNTDIRSATFDRTPIPVVFVSGNVNSGAFFLKEPVDAGFFDYDLFFRPTGSGRFELKQHVGGGSHLLPHLVTLGHDTFHNTTETWFDQSTDLRVLLARGNVCDDPGHPQNIQRCQQLYNFTPGVWVRGAGSWFELEDSAVTRANGRTYHHDLGRDLDVAVFESGIDFGKRDLFADGDILVFGVLGGAVEATLDYHELERSFDFGGGEVGAYATYLNGGLFVDTLFKTLFTELDPEAIRGFPDTLDHTTYGLRTDTGYRFGGMRYGPFIEPLATIAVSWGEPDDFALDGNAVDFDSDENVRGRVGLRLGTSTEVWNGTTMEPFIVGSLWGTLSGSHHATLTSNGAVFEFTDEPEDLWGVVSGGVNFFNPGAQTAVFAKVDYTFGDDTSGVGVRGGMRYNW